MTLRSRARKTGIKRPIILFACAVGVLVALILAVRHYRSEPLIGPESPEMVAKRTSPDNAWFALRELANGLPPTPPPGRPGILMDQRGSQDAAFIATRLAIRLPDDDPKVLEYLEATRPAAEAMPGILDTQPFYWPPLESVQANRENIAAFETLSRLLCGHALHAAKESRPEDAVRFALAALRLGMFVTCDGPLENALKGCELTSDAAVTAMSLPWGAYPSELGRTFLAGMKELSSKPIDLSAAIDWELRLVEAGFYTTSNPSQPDGLSGNLQDAALRRFLRKHAKALREAATISYAELPGWSSRHERARMIEQKALPTRFTSLAAEAVQRRTLAATQVEGLLAVVALELYRHAQGAYPETLEALTPDYAEAVPMDAYAAEPFRYSLKDGAYQMYSVGRVAGDDGGDAKRDLPVPPAIAAAFASSLTNPGE